MIYPRRDYHGFILIPSAIHSPNLLLCFKQLLKPKPNQTHFFFPTCIWTDCSGFKKLHRYCRQTGEAKYRASTMDLSLALLSELVPRSRDAKPEWTLWEESQKATFLLTSMVEITPSQGGGHWRDRWKLGPACLRQHLKSSTP